MKDRYRIRVKIERLKEDGECEVIARESRSLLERAEVSAAFRSAVDEADRAWRHFSWNDEEKQRKRR